MYFFTVTAARTDDPDHIDDIATAQSSSLRKKSVRLLEEDDIKYAGKPVSRKQLEKEENYGKKFNRGEENKWYKK